MVEIKDCINNLVKPKCIKAEALRQKTEAMVQESDKINL